jgi:hypothetical protein
VAPADISLLVVGRPPHEVIVPWEAASLAGRRAIDVLAPPVLMRLDARLPRLWPPGPATLGSAATRVLRTMATRAPRPCVVEVALSRAESAGGRAAMLPVRLGPRGIVDLLSPPLSTRDRVRLDSALAR